MRRSNTSLALGISLWFSNRLRAMPNGMKFAKLRQCNVAPSDGFERRQGGPSCALVLPAPAQFGVVIVPRGA